MLQTHATHAPGSCRPGWLSGRPREPRPFCTEAPLHPGLPTPTPALKGSQPEWRQQPWLLNEKRRVLG